MEAPRVRKTSGQEVALEGSLGGESGQGTMFRVEVF